MSRTEACCCSFSDFDGGADAQEMKARLNATIANANVKDEILFM
jgi:hypothetical protein